MKSVLYKNVYTKILTNNNATREGILDALDWLEDEPSQGDVVVLFISSHGFKEDEASYIMPYDGKADKLRATAIGFHDINQTVTNLSSQNGRACRVLLLLDACHSGQFGVQGTKGDSQLDIDDAVQTLNRKEYGVMMFHSSTGNEISYEDAKWKHGAFTYAILESLRDGKGDTNGNGIISFDELGVYVKERVKNLTKKQHSVIKNPASISEFPVIVIE